MVPRIRLHEKRQCSESKDLFLPESFKETLGEELPSCYTAKTLAIFKGDSEFEPDVAFNVEFLSLEVAEARVSGDYLMVAFKGRYDRDAVAKVMSEEYRKAGLLEAPELVGYVDVEAIRDELARIAVQDSEGQPWELGGSLGGNNDLVGIPGVVDAWYTPDAEVCLSASVFTFNVAENVSGSDIEETTSAEKAEELVKKFYAKYGPQEG